MGTLTTERLVTLVSALVKAKGNAVGAATIVAAARAAPWGEPYRYQRVYTALVRCMAQGALRRTLVENAPRGRGMRRTSYAWSPVCIVQEETPPIGTLRGERIDVLVDHVVGRLNAGTVITPQWIVRCLRHTRACTADEVRAALRRRTPDQRPMLTECSGELGWSGWWLVASADSVRETHAGRAASQRFWRRVRAAQHAAGRTAVEVRTLTKSPSPAARRTLIARISMSCRIPAAESNLILLTPRLVRCGAIHYASYVAPLGEEHMAFAELDVEAWWYAARLVERRHAEEMRSRLPLGDEVMAASRRTPFAIILTRLRHALGRVRQFAEGYQAELAWCARQEKWSQENPWRITPLEIDSATAEPATRWITITALQRLLAMHADIRHPPSVRLLRVLLRSSGIWMRPTRLVPRESMITAPHERSAAAKSAVAVEAVDAHVWMSARFLDHGNATAWRWVRRWLGLSRDWEHVKFVSQRADTRWADVATRALSARTAVSTYDA